MIDLLIDLFKEPLINYWNNYIFKVLDNKSVLQTYSFLLTLAIIAVVIRREYIVKWYWKKFMEESFIRKSDSYALLQKFEKFYLEMEEFIDSQQVVKPDILEKVDAFKNSLIASNVSDVKIAEISRLLNDLDKEIIDSLIQDGESINGDPLYRIKDNKRSFLRPIIHRIKTEINK